MRVSPGGGLRPASLPAGERNPRTAAWEERGDGLDRRPPVGTAGRRPAGDLWPSALTTRREGNAGQFSRWGPSDRHSGPQGRALR